jgi:hypothetical protein
MAVSRTRGRDFDTAPPKSDVYTGLLAISLCAMLIGCLMLYLDYASYPPGKPPTPPSPTVIAPPAAQP